MSTNESDASANVDRETRRLAERHASLDGQEPETIERDIDATRADVRATLEALEHRLSFDRLIELTVGRVRERGGEFAGNLSEAAAQNPLPLLLAGIGLGWLMLTSRHKTPASATAGARARAPNAAGKVASAAETVSGQVHDAVESSREALGHATESVRERASRAADMTRGQVVHARERIDRLLEEQPLLLGAFGLAAGALMGALLPTTEAEDRWLGEARDEAVKKAAQASRTRYEAARAYAAAYSAPISGADEDAGGGRPSRPH